jgi:hypothetical protein
VPGDRLLVALLLTLLHTAVALAPCPPLPEAGPRHCHESSGSAALAHDLKAPCPCGCGQRQSSWPTARLGPVLVADAPRLAPIDVAFAAPAPGADRLVEADLAAPDPVPRSSA